MMPLLPDHHGEMTGPVGALVTSAHDLRYHDL
jgi:hypothetical protein